jgi:hypothetical protein
MRPSRRFEKSPHDTAAINIREHPLMGLALERMPDWPVAMTREMALAYTGVADAQLREWERRGTVRFCMRGPRGAAIAARSSLDAAVQSLFAAAADDGAIEFD